MSGLVSSARLRLTGQLLPVAGLGNCEWNCTVFRCRIEFRFIVYWSMNIVWMNIVNGFRFIVYWSMNISQDKVKNF